MLRHGAEQTVRVNRDALIETVRQNRDAHRDKFLAAQEKYRERVIEELDKRLAEVRRGRPISLGFHLPEPVDYTETYDEALAMLEWEEREEVNLDHSTFRQLVLDKWEWQGIFAANTESYIGSA